MSARRINYDRRKLQTAIDETEIAGLITWMLVIMAFVCLLGGARVAMQFGQWWLLMIGTACLPEIAYGFFVVRRGKAAVWGYEARHCLQKTPLNPL